MRSAQARYPATRLQPETLLRNLARIAKRSVVASMAAAMMGLGVCAAGESHGPGRFIEFDMPTTRAITTPHVVIWVPPGYDSGSRRYAVVYMHDGQNVFFIDRSNFHKIWAADQSALRLIESRRVAPFIIVAIDYPKGDRTRQYMPARLEELVSAETRRKLDEATQGPNISDDYLEFIAHELKPRVDRDFRTKTDREHTAIVGSSMGGLISLYAIARYPQVFALAGCLSTHLPLGDPQALGPSNPDIIRAWQQFVTTDLGPPSGRRIWFDHGTETLDSAYAPYQDTLDAALRANGWTAGKDFSSRVYAGAAHEENAWAARLDDVLAWLLAPPGPKRQSTGNAPVPAVPAASLGAP